MDISINVKFTQRPLKCWEETAKRANHLFERMRERGITIGQIREAVSKGVKTLKENGTIVAEHRWYKVIYREFVLGKERKIYPITVIEK